MAPARTPSGASAGTAPRLGLRERKKLRTRRAIRQAAYRLFAERGYDATPVDRIAEEAEVSPSTVFRYFPTKEDIVLTDGYDPLVEEELRGRPADEPPVRAVREALCSVLERVAEEDRDLAEVHRRVRLIRDVPAVRARWEEHNAATRRLLTTVLSERTGRPVDDLGLRVVVSATLAALTEALFVWAENGMRGSPSEQVGRALDVLERGLTL